MDGYFPERDADELQALAPYEVHGVVINDLQRVGRLNLLIEEWLLEKYRQTRSGKTRETYRSILHQYRAALQQQGLDLDRQDCLVQLVSTARLFATFSARGKEVAVGNSNLCPSTPSSFFEVSVPKDLVRPESPH